MPWRPQRYWHTQILGVIGKTRAFFLTDIRHGPEEHGALVQAARELSEEGAIRTTEAPLFGTIISRPTDGRPDPLAVRRLSGVSR
jgi:hypothetical protein